jgi:DNA-binding NarL/FixJ family response regulator
MPSGVGGWPAPDSRTSPKGSRATVRARPARPSPTSLDLAPAQIRIVQQVAEGKNTHAIATDLTITAARSTCS